MKRLFFGILLILFCLCSFMYKDSFLDSIRNRITLDEYAIRFTATIVNVEPLVVNLGETDLHKLKYDKQTKFNLNDDVDIYFYSNMIFVTEDYICDFIVDNFRKPYLLFQGILILITVFYTGCNTLLLLITRR